MSPTIVTRDGKPFIAVGSPGGSTIPGTVLQILLERLDLGTTAARGDRAPARRRSATRRPRTAEPAFINSPEGQALAARTGTRFTSMAEIGAVTGIEFLPAAARSPRPSRCAAAAAARRSSSRESPSGANPLLILTTVYSRSRPL